jgi:carbamate kinase
VLADGLRADLLVIATDVDAVYLDWGTPEQAAVAAAHPDALAEFDFPAGSMGPKVAAACGFTNASGKPAVIGSLNDLTGMLAGTAGTRVDVNEHGVKRR